jgi:DNA-binding NarL/FixJ family response regulator
LWGTFDQGEDMTDCNGPLLRASVQHQLPVIRGGIVATLRCHPEIQVISELEHPEALVDVIVTDYDHGLLLASKRSSGKAGARLLIVTATERETDVRAALNAGITGYVLYDCTPEELTSAVVTLGCGGRHFCARVVERMADSLMHEALTPRELDVLSLMIRGLNNKLIARELRISIGTVKAHANAVYGKLNASSRLHAVAVAVARGIGSSPPSIKATPHAPGFAARLFEHDHRAIVPA